MPLILINAFQFVYAQIVCEQISTRQLHQVPVVLLQVCRMDLKTVINTQNATISTNLDVNMTEIYMDFNSAIYYLPINTSLSFPNLLSISCFSSALKMIRKENFQSLVLLRKLDFSSNQIQTISRDVFQNLTNLETLLLGNNKITTLNGDAFRPLVKLTYLGLIGNICINKTYWGTLNFAEISQNIGQACATSDLYQTCKADLQATIKKLEDSENAKNACIRNCPSSGDTTTGIESSSENPFTFAPDEGEATNEGDIIFK